MLKVSIIVPVYNVEKYIDKCLKSLVEQTLDDIEIIVVNDGSTDDSKKVIDNYIERYPEKIVYLEKKNGGLSDARNYGMPYAKGEYIAFLDSDDIFYHDKLEKQIKNLKNKKADFDFCKIYVHINITYSINYILPKRSQEQSIINGDIFEELTKGNFISTQAILVKKK